MSNSSPDSPLDLFVQELVQFNSSISKKSTSEILDFISSANITFIELERIHSQNFEATEVKFLFQQMRTLLEGHLVTLPISVDTIKIFSELKLKLSLKTLHYICTSVISNPSTELMELTGNLLANLGEGRLLEQYFSSLQNIEDLKKMAGPQKLLPMMANRRSRATTEKWMKMEEFSNYQFIDNGVIYRGMELHTGDMILSNVNLDGNGVFTTLIEPKGYAYHFGIIAILENDGRKYPVVVETYEIGVRIVPLSQFVSKNFNCYFEVYRLNKIPSNFYDSINKLSEELPAKVKGYNFDTEDPDFTYLACTSVATCLFQNAGIDPIPSKTHYSKKGNILKNLDTIELITGPFLSPWDFISSSKTHCVGLFDNGYFSLNVARELCELYMFGLFEKGTLEIKKMPFLYFVNCFGVKRIQENKLLGKLLSRIVGFTHSNLPRASYKILASIEIFEHTMVKCVRRLHRNLESRDLANRYQSLNQIKDELKADIEKAMRPFIKLFY